MSEHVSSYNKTARIPRVGSRWVWEINSIGDLIEVVAVKWNGEEWWVKTKLLKSPWPLGHGGEHWNDLGRFVEAVTQVGTKGHWQHPPQVHEGEEWNASSTQPSTPPSPTPVPLPGDTE